MKAQTISRQSLIQYGFIAMPMAFAGFPLYVLAPDFYATHQGLSLTLLGTMLLVIRLFDAVQDPLIGWLVDKFQSLFVPFATIAGSILCMAVFGLFNLVVINPVAWFALCMFVAVGAYSVLSIVLGAWATLWTVNKTDQTRIAGARESFGLIGLVIAVSLPPLLFQLINPESVYVWYSLILAVLMSAGVAGLSKLPKPAKMHKEDTAFFSGLRALPTESLRLLGVYGASMLASSIPAVLVIFYVRDLLGLENLTGFFLMLYFLSGAATMPLWKMISARFGKYKTWILSTIIAVTGFIGAFFLCAGDIWAYAVVCIISGLALGADLTLPPSLLAEHLHAYDKVAYSGTHYALMACVAKASLALASAIALPMLDAAGFKPHAENSKQALMALSIGYALIPCALKLVAAGLIYKFFVRSQSGGNHEAFQNSGRNRISRHA